MDWRHRSACLDEDPELFFPVGGDGPPSPAHRAQVDAALLVCARCPVTAECGDFAEETAQDWGIWGGESRDEVRRNRRRAIKRESAAATRARKALT